MSVPLAAIVPGSAQSIPCARILGLRVAALNERDAAERLIQAALAGYGHWTITANLDHLRRYQRDPQARRLLDSADVVVADGTPLVWASRLAGTPLPERVAGADMIWSISEAAGEAGISVYLLGGNRDVAEQAARVLRERYPALRIAGTLCPPHGFEGNVGQLDEIERALSAAKPGIVMVALGFPKQDLVIERLRAALPHASLLGVGIGLSFVAGELRRCPHWTGRLGLEWCHRLAHEPRRLAGRYLLHGVPFGLWLLGSAAGHRLTRARPAHRALGRWGWETGS
jgi:N-acetylglucosaminyldiphosphoundecaprenol N-acetyl-beta-D-mannosaminyltransferase